MTIDTPQAAAEERQKLSRAIREAVDEQKKAGLERADIKSTYLDQYNEALLKSERSNEAQRRAEAHQATARLSRELLKAEVIESFWKTRVAAIESDMRLLMTITKAIRVEFEEAHRAPVGAS